MRYTKYKVEVITKIRNTPVYGIICGPAKALEPHIFDCRSMSFITPIGLLMDTVM